MISRCATRNDGTPERHVSWAPSFDAVVVGGVGEGGLLYPAATPGAFKPSVPSCYRRCPRSSRTTPGPLRGREWGAKVERVGGGGSALGAPWSEACLVRDVPLDRRRHPALRDWSWLGRGRPIRWPWRLYVGALRTVADSDSCLPVVDPPVGRDYLTPWGSSR